MNKNKRADLAAFIREHRSNESNFETLYKKLDDEIKNHLGNTGYSSALQQLQQKAAEEYRKAKDTNGSAWPEFEKFVSGFERAIMEANNTL